MLIPPFFSSGSGETRLFTPLGISFCFLFSSFSSLFPFYTPYLRSLKFPPLFQASPIFPPFSPLFKNFPPVLTIFPSPVSCSKQKPPLSFVLFFPFFFSLLVLRAVFIGQSLLLCVGSRGAVCCHAWGEGDVGWGLQWGRGALGFGGSMRKERGETVLVFFFKKKLFYLLGTQKWVTTTPNKFGDRSSS
jgi:hypothetical protein